tara:strand:- start:11372 stop:11854 length:483 start_codon:yes stop_codon:yes gene_type:complete
MQQINELMVQMSKLPQEDFRDKMGELTQLIVDNGGTIRESYKENDKIDVINGNKLEHFFGEGTYIRKITMNKNTLIMSAIHLVTHPYFILTGKATILSPGGLHLVEAPKFGITTPGTQRLLYIHEDMEFYTVHPTEKTNVEEIINEVTSTHYNHPKLKLN